MENTATLQAETATEKPTTQCQHLGHCREHKPCCFCAEEQRVISEFLSLQKAA